MKQIILILFILSSCVKREYIIPFMNYANKIELSKDTTVTGVWDGGGKVLRINDHIIHGSGWLQNWIIDAALTQQIFDTTLNLRNIQTYGDRFSTAWYGTSSISPDNYWNIQKSINVCRDNHLACFTPGRGIYKFSKGLSVTQSVGNSFQQTSLHFFGDASYWDNGLGTTFQYTGKSGPAFYMQLNKGSEIDHVVFTGLWKSPGGSDSVYFNTPESRYKDQSGFNLDENYVGIAVDWATPKDGSISGSTGIYIHEVSLEGFAVGLANSQNQVTLNNDNMTVDHLYLMDNIKYGIVNGQAQEKGMHFTNVYSWGSIYEVVNIGLRGRAQAGNYSFDGVYIAGRCIQFGDVSVSHWYGQTFNNVFCESIARIGNFSSAGETIVFTNSNFDLNLNVGRQIAINSNALQTEFDHCTIRYFDDKGTDVWVHGYMTFLNCFYGNGAKIIYK